MIIRYLTGELRHKSTKSKALINREKGVYNERITVVLKDWQNSDVLLWPTHAHLGLQATSPRFQTSELPLVWHTRKCFQVLMLSMRLIILDLQFYSWDSGISRGQPTFLCGPSQPASYTVSAKQNHVIF